MVTGLPESGAPLSETVGYLGDGVEVVESVVMVEVDDELPEVSSSGSSKSLPITILICPGSRVFEGAVGSPPSRSAAWVASVSAPGP